MTSIATDTLTDRLLDGWDAARVFSISNLYVYTEESI